MRVTSPAVTIKDIWDALVADYGAAGTYGLLMETNLDAKVSAAKADVSALATTAALTAAKTVIDAIVIDTAGIAGDVMRGTDSAALASAWTAALATILGNFSAARIGYLDNINQAGLLQLTVARAALLDNIGEGPYVTESDNLITSHDATVTESGAAPAKKLEFVVLVAGTYRIKYDMRHSTGSKTAYSSIRKNGEVVYGPESTSSTEWQAKTEDLFYEVHDLLQLYMNVSVTDGAAEVRNFRIYGDLGTGSLVEVTL